MSPKQNKSLKQLTLCASSYLLSCHTYFLVSSCRVKLNLILIPIPDKKEEPMSIAIFNFLTRMKGVFKCLHLISYYVFLEKYIKSTEQKNYQSS